MFCRTRVLFFRVYACTARLEFAGQNRRAKFAVPPSPAKLENAFQRLSDPILGCDSKKPVQEGSIGLVVFGAGHVNRAEPPELFKGGAFAKLAKRPESPVSAKAPALNARSDLSSPQL